MPNPIPAADIAEGLDLAIDLGVLRGWRRVRPEGGSRHWVLMFADGDQVRYTAGAADAFALGVRLTADRLDTLPTR